MPDQTDLDELIAYLSRTTRLTPAEATRVVHEVLNFLDETPEDFIRRRHRELQSSGCSNTEIFSRLATELTQWRFRASDFSERQIRRVIYG
ncbi:hypothetical protein [Povalibacter sp.]|uniref:hypothetical protein n=1 Tax=Povalibacter sp. TaxID=1962978 RepID=UPI002F41CA07